VTKTKSYLAGGMAVLLGSMILLPVAANAEDADLRAINNRLDRVERSLSDVQRNSGGGGFIGGSDAPASGDTGLRLSEIEEQMRGMTGRIEELGHQINVIRQDLNSYKEANDLRFSEQGAASAPVASAGSASAASAASKPAASAASSSAAPLVALPSGTPQTQYDFAIDLLKRGQFPEARDGFKQFLVQHPKDPLAGNAQYWLGETYYVQGQYKDAADSFLKGYTTYSKSSKAPDSLLKLGMTLAALKQKDAACATFGQLKEQFPSASPAIVARNKQERQKVGC
tara:strand:+ start:16930 stop:17781 length:852 start_codon:yes stop_codon:yes gene_type:complete